MSKLVYYCLRTLFVFSLMTASNAALAITSDTVTGSNFVDGQTVYTITFADNLTATFTGSRAFKQKTQDSMTGVGVAAGRTAGEIDIDETITASFSKEVIVSSLTLGLLFDGPEYSDVQEVAKLLVNFADGGSDIFYLTATGAHSATWTGPGSVSPLGSGAVDGGTGAWELTNPFGFRSVTNIQFTAATGVAKSSCSSCNNQSDYTFVSMTVTPVPEVNSLAMFTVALFMFGGIAARKSAL
ncbi:hypothetical protein [Methylophilus aquaticus]|uniref:PEP-CTERM sorting domain-containing protein n=1 Tax=Methylophilus aquaticus TaxID=1971610 RepID=A0ABT9JQ69_9PROT|nr:hypothetical protein [Methylophilus aquaticus]MDP8566676.1 hypothetical protein [Methylophilus aquaticus]